MLCQAPAQFGFPAVAELILTVEFHMWADFQLFRSFSFINISIVLSSTGIDLQLLEIKFCYLQQFHYYSGWQGGWLD